MIAPEDLRESGWKLYRQIRKNCDTLSQLRLEEAIFALREPLRREALLILLQTLNTEQLAALLHSHAKDGPLLILAGAGSGKTAVLTRRIVYLLLEGIDPQAIFAVTFTNKAAGEMRERVKKLLEQIKQPLPASFHEEIIPLEVAVDEMWIGTFHSACLRFLKDQIPGSPEINIERFGFRPVFKVMDPLVSKALVERAMESEGPAAQALGLEFFLDGIEKARNELRTSAILRETAEESPANGYVANVLDAYQEMKRQRRLLDFNDIISFAVELLQQDDAVIEYYREKFQYVMIDEYQDTNFAQYVLARQLSKSTPNIFVVGDDDQSIYGWRGADIRNILAFREDYPDARIIKLVKNYRSSRMIITAANHIFDGMKPEELRKELEPVRVGSDGEVLEGEKIVEYTAEDGYDEVEFCAFIIAQAHAAGRPYGDFAIFYRTNEQSRVVKDVLEKANLPYLEFGDHRFFNMREIKNTLNYLKLIDVIAQVRMTGAEGIEESVLNDASQRLQQLLSVPDFNFSAESLAAADHFLETYRVLTDDRQYAALQERLVPDDRPQFDRFIDDFYRQVNLAAEGQLVKLVQQIWRHLGYAGQIEVDDNKARSLKKNLDGFMHLVEIFQSRFAAEEGYGYLRRFIQDIEEKQRDPQSLVATGDGAVLLMTLHSSKGLEFPVVFFLGLEEDLCPLRHPSERELSAAERQERYEEELRLFYVGITRAQEKLYLVRARQRTRYGRLVRFEPSSFLKLIPSATRVRGNSSGSAVVRLFDKIGKVLSS